MKKFNHSVFTLLVFGMLISPSFLSADNKDIALVLKTKGTVGVKNPTQRGYVRAKRGNRLDDGEIIKTGKNSLAALVFTDDKSQIKIRSNSSVTIRGKREKKGIVKRLSLSFGQIWANVTRQKTDMRIETPSGVATVKGTIFNCLFQDNNFFVFCQQGLLQVANQFGTMRVGANQLVQLTLTSAPQRLQVDPDSIFDLSDEEDGSKLRIEFEDEQGNKKSLILDFN